MVAHKAQILICSNQNLVFWGFFFRYKQERLRAARGDGDPGWDHEDGGETGYASFHTGGAEVEGDGWGQGPGKPAVVQGLRVSLDPGKRHLEPGEAWMMTGCWCWLKRCKFLICTYPICGVDENVLSDEFSIHSKKASFYLALRWYA